jgi:hypothetical protein
VTDDLVERVAIVFLKTPGKPSDRFRAAIALALEEAAKMAESFTTPPIASDFGTVIVDQGGEIAAAIRAMIQKEE